MKTILVTGSTKGIGRAIVKLFSNENYNVVITYKSNKDLAHKLVDEISKYNKNVIACYCDVRDEDSVKSLYIEIINKFENIDVIVNNAALSSDSLLEDKTASSFLEVLNTNVVGPFLIIKQGLKYMKKGTIINICSTDGLDTYSEISLDYCASKAALINLTKNLNDNYNNINFFALCPNWVDTEAVLEMNPSYLKDELGRVGQKELIKKEAVAKKVWDIVNNTKKYNVIVRIDDDNV